MPRRRYRKWSKQLVLEKIRNRYGEGKKLCRTWKEDKVLYRTAKLQFGNWHNALRAAGVPSRHRRKLTPELLSEQLLRWHQTPGTRDLAREDPQLANYAIKLFGSINAALGSLGLESKKRRRWSKQKIVSTIQDNYVQGRSININGCGDRRLHRAALRYFGSWANAVAEAGLADKFTPLDRGRNWSQEAVLQAIKDWCRQGKRIGDVCKEDSGLLCAGQKYFGSWSKAVIAAGFTPGRTRIWSRELIIEKIQERVANGLSVRCTCKDMDMKLVIAARKYFGGWRLALVAAGIDVKVHKWRKKR